METEAELLELLTKAEGDAVTIEHGDVFRYRVTASWINGNRIYEAKGNSDTLLEALSQAEIERGADLDYSPLTQRRERCVKQ